MSAGEGEDVAMPDLISGLDEAILTEIFLWLGDGSYRYIAATSPHFRKVYRRVGTSTSAEQMVQTVDGAMLFRNEARGRRIAFANRLEHPDHPHRYTYNEEFVRHVAALHGNMKVLELACGWGRMVDLNSAFRLAASNGHVHVLEWLLVQYNDDCDQDGYDIFYGAAYRGRLEVLQWAIDKGYDWDTWACETAACGGQLEALQWLRERGCPWDSTACSSAAENGHLLVLQWLRKQGCPWDAETCAMAACGGHLEVLKWAREHDCPWNSETCFYAAASGDLFILKWAREHGCPWDADTCARAVVGGHFEMLQWAREHGCPWDEQTILVAEAYREYDIVDWARENGCPCSDAVSKRLDERIGRDW